MTTSQSTSTRGEGGRRDVGPVLGAAEIIVGVAHDAPITRRQVLHLLLLLLQARVAAAIVATPMALAHAGVIDVLGVAGVLKVATGAA